MVPQGDLIAPQRLSQAVQVSPPHSGAEVAAVLRLALGDGEDVGVKDLDGNAQQGGVLLDLRPVHRMVSGIHDQIFRLKGHLTDPLELLDELGLEHGILAAGDAHGHPISRLNEFVSLHRGDEGVPQFLPVFFHNAALDELQSAELTCHLFCLHVSCCPP